MTVNKILRDLREIRNSTKHALERIGVVIAQCRGDEFGAIAGDVTEYRAYTVILARVYPDNKEIQEMRDEAIRLSNEFFQRHLPEFTKRCVKRE